jgi:hypothetical protein
MISAACLASMRAQYIQISARSREPGRVIAGGVALLSASTACNAMTRCENVASPCPNDSPVTCVCAYVCAYVCVRACVRACVRVCVRAVRACQKVQLLPVHTNVETPASV